MNHRPSLCLLLLVPLWLTLTTWTWAGPQESISTEATSTEATAAAKNPTTQKTVADKANATVGLTRLQVLAGSFTVFVLAIFVGFEIIAKVPPTLHTPLMSGSNAISGITVVGAIIAAGHLGSWIGNGIATIAIVLAMANVVGGFVVTHRMLLMFKRK
jgi:H+-translocating NAD(P) transhydrogenase subunit alpha